MRSPLKWAGGKKRVIDDILKIMPIKNKKRLVEPFVGGGSVFLNTDFDQYLLIDMNNDLIELFNTIKTEPLAFINDAASFFKGNYNQAEKYYSLRQTFNESSDTYERSL